MNLSMKKVFAQYNFYILLYYYWFSIILLLLDLFSSFQLFFETITASIKENTPNKNYIKKKVTNNYSTEKQKWNLSAMSGR